VGTFSRGTFASHLFMPKGDPPGEGVSCDQFACQQENKPWRKVAFNFASRNSTQAANAMKSDQELWIGFYLCEEMAIHVRVVIEDGTSY